VCVCVCVCAHAHLRESVSESGRKGNRRQGRGGSWSKIFRCRSILGKVQPSSNLVTGTESRTHDLLPGGVAPAVLSINDYCSTSSFNAGF